jgi:IS605 OrfB family transposase
VPRHPTTPHLNKTSALLLGDLGDARGHPECSHLVMLDHDTIILRLDELATFLTSQGHARRNYKYRLARTFLELHLQQYGCFDRPMKIGHTGSMNTMLTAKLKLQTDSGQLQALRRTQLAYRDALNYVSRYAFAQSKLSNKVGLQSGTYTEIRARFGLPAQMACSIPRQDGATYKALWTKLKTNAEARRAGWTKKRFKGLDQPVKYVSPTLTYQFGHDYSFKTEQRVSILTLDRRVVLSYSGYDRHIALIQSSAQIGAAKLWYDKSRKRFYLLVSLELETAAPTSESHRHVVGVDMGQRYLAVATDTRNHTVFYAGQQVRAQADHYARLRQRLQRKGTRSATRRLVVISGRERRLKRNRNHLISRRIVVAYPHSLIGLEDLTHIRERTNRASNKRASKRQRQANRHASSWAFAELHGSIAYKAQLAGSMAVKVDAYHTSQACLRCGHTSPDNRPNKGLVFVCQACGLTLHADLVGARNIALRTLLVRQDWARTCVLSERPDVSGEEAKAAQRRRYAELRWSLDTSPAREGWGI